MKNSIGGLVLLTTTFVLHDPTGMAQAHNETVAFVERATKIDQARFDLARCIARGIIPEQLLSELCCDEQIQVPERINFTVCTSCSKSLSTEQDLRIARANHLEICMRPYINKIYKLLESHNVGITAIAQAINRLSRQVPVDTFCLPWALCQAIVSNQLGGQK